MNPRHSTHRRAFEGTLVVRVSLVALGLAASVGLQLAEPEQSAPASWTASNPSTLCTMEAAGSVGFQPSLQ
ncbi:MAG: hypothetical protein KIT60_29830 [Burkholderiaceae bacterium]|nr:hypothetical protein [Burkholderiaceae bacterium]